VYRGSRAVRRANLRLRLSFLANFVRTKNGQISLKLPLKRTKNEARFLNVKVSYCPRPPVRTTPSPSSRAHFILSCTAPSQIAFYSFMYGRQPDCAPAVRCGSLLPRLGATGAEGCIATGRNSRAFYGQARQRNSQEWLYSVAEEAGEVDSLLAG
jgi:hypothetical protein